MDSSNLAPIYSSLERIATLLQRGVAGEGFMEGEVPFQLKCLTNELRTTNRHLSWISFILSVMLLAIGLMVVK
jgi:hypothetical protein